MCFFYGTGDKPAFTYAGIATQGCKDLESEKLVEAFKRARELLGIMEDVMREKLEENA
jgi:hypothetical protein